MAIKILSLTQFTTMTHEEAGFYGRVMTGLKMTLFLSQYCSACETKSSFIHISVSHVHGLSNL